MTSTDKPATAREYLRVSRDKSGRERSPEEQHGDHEQAASERGVKLGKPYRDVGSASKYASKAREGYDKLIADLSAGKFGADELWLWEGSRGSRKVSEWVQLIELCQQREVKIFIHTYDRLFDPANDYDQSDLIDLANKSQLASAETSKRAKRAQKATAREGKPNGRVPYGYQRIYDPITRKLVRQEEEPAEAKVIREVYDRLYKGHSLRSIAKDLEARGVRSRVYETINKKGEKETRGGVVFSAQHLRSMVLTRTYVGERVHDPARFKAGTRTTKGRLTTDAAITKATWPALVSREVFFAVQARLLSPDRVTTRPGRAVHLLSMIAACDVCGGPLTARGPAGRDQEYTCRNAGHIRVNHQELTHAAERLMLTWLADPDKYGNLRHGDEDDGTLAKVREDLAEARAELQLANAEEPETVAESKVIAKLITRLEAKVSALEEQERELTMPTVLSTLIKPGKDVERRWKAAPMSVRREVARYLLSPGVLGQLRVGRSTPGHRVPIQDRVTMLHE